MTSDQPSKDTVQGEHRDLIADVVDPRPKHQEAEGDVNGALVFVVLDALTDQNGYSVMAGRLGDHDFSRIIHRGPDDAHDHFKQLVDEYDLEVTDD